MRNLVAALLGAALMANGLALAQQPSTGGTPLQTSVPTNRPAKGQPPGGASKPGSSAIPPGADEQQMAATVLKNATNDQDKDLQLIQNVVQKKQSAQSVRLQQARVGELAVYKPGKSSKKSGKRSSSTGSSQKRSGVKPSH